MERNEEEGNKGGVRWKGRMDEGDREKGRKEHERCLDLYIYIHVKDVYFVVCLSIYLNVYL